MILKWTAVLLSVNILLVSCERESSLAFVIDDTRSMGDDIAQVKEAAKEIMNIVSKQKSSQIKETVLVTFNDPDVVLRAKTSDRNTFLGALRSIIPHNYLNRDCKEFSLSGIEKALKESRPNSYLYVFTDATAKDHKKVNDVIGLCQKKQSQVVFVLTGDCGASDYEEYKVYHRIAKSCNGQVFRVHKDNVKDILNTVGETVKGQKTVVTSKVLPPSYDWQSIPFTFDDQTEFVVISVSGRRVDLVISGRASLKYPLKFIKKAWLSSTKVVEFAAPTPGTYYAWVKGKTEISIIVYARTDFSFSHGFSSFVPKSLDDASKQPIAGKEQHLSINVEDPNDTVNIKNANILDMHEILVTRLTLRRVKGNFYMTDKFISPSSTFKIQVTGINKHTGNVIKRFARTSVDPQAPPKPASKSPEVVITEGTQMLVDYHGGILLTCKVSAYPEPEIYWISDRGQNYYPKSNMVEKPYDYISYLKLNHVTSNGTYKCRASNSGGSRFSKIYVMTQSPFKPISTPTGTTTAKFGEEKRLICDVFSQLPMKITWSLPLKSSDYSLSADKKALTIKAVTLEAQGKYTCRTTLKSDPNQTYIATTILKIKDLAPPTILNKPSHVIRKYGEWVQIICKLTGGVPKPKVSWAVIKKGDKAFRSHLNTGEVFTIKAATLEDSGKYRCIAENYYGQTERTTELLIIKAPVAIITEGSTKSVDYGSSNTLTCKVVASPLPEVVWMDGRGNTLVSQEFTHNNGITSQLRIHTIKASETYSCFAKNDVGTTVSKIDLTVSSPFIVHSHPPATTVSKYKATTDITCNIRSNYEIKIKWFYHSASGQSEIRQSDKFAITSNGKTLTITSTDLNNTGKYTCVAAMTSDDKQAVAFTTDVHLNDLSPPVLQDAASTKIIVNDKDKASISCKTVKGTPPPTITWQVRRKGDRAYKNLPDAGQELTIASASLDYAGHYRCLVKNDFGEKIKDAELLIIKAPVAIITEGSTKSVDYGSSNTLTCKVVASPLPEVVWMDGRGNTLVSQEFTHNNGITSQLRIHTIKASETYSCFAKNDVGTTVSKIDLTVSSPFIVHSHPPATTVSKYKATTDITCNIRSNYEIKIKWFYHSASGQSEIRQSDKFAITSNGKTLTITSTDLNNTGKYTCVAAMTSDDKQAVAFTTDVHLNDLSPPVLQDAASTKIIVNDKDKASISCKTVKGTPPPTITWQVRRKGDRAYKNLPDAGQELTIASASLDYAGHYRCLVKNDFGEKIKDAELLIIKAPVAIITEGSTKSVDYGSSNTLTCKVVASPLPEVVWMDGRGNTLVSQEFTHNNGITSQLRIHTIKASETYSCFAKNDVGTTVSKIDLTVSSPFIVHSHPPATTVSKYKATTDITCNIRSNYEIKIKWFYHSASGQSEIRQSDKFAITSNGKTLTITSTDLNNTGKYTCVAAMTSDDKQAVAFTTDVHLNDLSPPVLQDAASTKIIVNDKDKASISCKTVKGTPPPTITWQVRREGDRAYKNLPDAGQELTIASASLDYAGHYRCLVKNDFGEKIKDAELVINKSPEVIIDGGASVSVPYGSNYEVKCRVVAYPPPKVVWEDSQGHKLRAKNFRNKQETFSILDVINARTSETYYCIAENNLGQTNNSKHIRVLPAIIFAAPLPESTSVNYGARAKVLCDAKSSFPMKVKWFYQKNEDSDKIQILTSNKYTISPEGKMLEIISTDLDSVGKYRCEVTLASDVNQNISRTYKVEIDDLKAPEILISEKALTVMKGQSLAPSYKINGVPKPTIAWQFKAKDSETFNPIAPEWMQIVNIGYNSAGTYKCIATNAVGNNSGTIEISVHGAPQITNAKSVFFGITGDEVLTLPCNVTGVPEPSIIWKRAGQVVTSDAKITTDKNALLIKYPTTKDSGNFTCEATNKYGSARHNVEADISDFIETDPDNSRRIYLKLGESTDIKCDLTNSGPLSIRWYVNSEKSSQNLTYLIRNAQYSNDGNYTCRANTKLGSESVNYVVDVGYEPSFLRSSISPIDWNGNKNDKLDCTVNAKPRENVIWYYNGEMVQGAYSELPIIGWGSYTCNVSNPHGSVQRSFNVTSSECVINRNVDRVQNTPLLFSEGGATWPQLSTENEFYIIPNKESLYLQCATTDQPINTFRTHQHAKTITAQCHKEDLFSVEGKMYKFEDLQCKEYVEPSIQFTKKPCLTNGELIEIGFKLNSGFLGVYDTCYAQTDQRIRYTKVSMSDSDVYQPGFGAAAKTSNVDQIVKCQYAQRRLVRPEYVAFGPAQVAVTLTDQYNTLPVFEPCDGTARVSWSGVEEIVINALYAAESFSVWTGASHYSAAGIPRYLWKVVKFSDDADDVEAIVYVNAPDATDQDVLCSPNVPDRLWNINTGDKFKYSCTIDDFSNAFHVSITDLI